VTLLDASRGKCRFLDGWAPELPNVEVVWGRAEEQDIETFGIALAKALAKPTVAAELTLPLVRVGGIALVWAGATADRTAVQSAATLLAAELEADDAGLLVLRKTGATPLGFPRRPGMAKKRPLA
jgi:16S rRNA (guanine527-N7)-methyltransferase